MSYRVTNLRRLRRRTNKRKIIKGQGFLDFLRKNWQSAKQWGERKLPQVVEGVKEVGKRHLSQFVNEGMPMNKKALLERGKSFAKEAFETAKSKLRGSGRLQRLRAKGYPPAKRLRFRR